MVLSHPLVAAPIVAGPAGHQLLRVVPLDLGHKGGRPVAAQSRRHLAVVEDEHGTVRADLVIETLWGRHGELSHPRGSHAMTLAGAMLGVGAVAMLWVNPPDEVDESPIMPLGSKRSISVYDRVVVGSDRDLYGAETARQALEESITGLTKERARYIEQRLVPGDPAQVLLDTVGANPANLIVVGNRGLGASEGQLLGSVPGDIVKNAVCDVLIVQTSALDEERLFAADEQTETAGATKATEVGPARTGTDGTSSGAGDPHQG